MNVKTSQILYSIYDKANLMKLIDINININFLRNKFDMLTNWIHRDCNDF